MLSFTMVLQRSVLPMTGKQGEEEKEKGAVGTAIIYIFYICIYKKYEALLTATNMIKLILIPPQT